MLLGILLISVMPYLLIGKAVEPTMTRPGCIHPDGTYQPPGFDFLAYNCHACFCKDNGETNCYETDCLTPWCVDYNKDKDECCYTCPNGFNCYLNGKIIPADQDFEVGEMTCRCPQGNGWMGKPPLDIQAQCSPTHPDNTGPFGRRV